MRQQSLTRSNERGKFTYQKFTALVRSHSNKPDQLDFNPKTLFHAKQRPHRYQTQIEPEQYGKRGKSTKNIMTVQLPALEHKIRTSLQGNSSSIIDAKSEKQQSKVNETVHKTSEKVKAISDVNPRINKLKMNFLRKENIAQSKRKIQYCYWKPRKEKSTFQVQKVRVNLSCQSIMPLYQEDEASKWSQHLKSNEKDLHSNFRYKQIPPQEFIYENKSPILNKSLVQRISQIMRKTKRKDSKKKSSHE